jgi:hypothetical protein
MLVPGDPGIPRTLAPTDYKEFSPGRAIAYSPSTGDGILGKILGSPGKSSIRAAYRIYYTAVGPLGGFGNSNRRFFRGPGFNYSDVALHKDTRITEQIAVQFRAEFFNVFNHAQFNNPNGNFSSSNFGAVTSARDPRIGQMSLKLLW